MDGSSPSLPSSADPSAEPSADAMGSGVGLGITLLFGLPFAAFGVAALVTSAHEARDGGPGGPALAALDVVFIVASLGLPLAFLRASRRQRATRARWPDAPWMWSGRWRDGRVRGSERATARLAWVMALAFLGFSVPLLLAIPAELARGNTPVLLGLIFPLTGLGLLLWAGRVTQRWRRFGASEIRLATFPGVVGGRLEGTLQLGTDVRPEGEGFRFRLTCIRRRSSRGRNSGVDESVLWQTSETFGSGVMGPQGTAVDFGFTIPSSARPTDPESGNDRILWRLEVRAAVPGIDYWSTFEVPVFRTAQSRANVVEPIEAPEPVALGGAEQEVPGSTVRIRPWRGGLEFWFGPARHKVAALSLTAMVVIAAGVGALFFAQDGPGPATAIAGVFVLLTLWGSLWMWTATTSVRIDASGVMIRRSMLGLGRTRTLPAASVEGFRVVDGMQINDRRYHDLRVLEKRPGGASTAHAAGSAIPDRRAAEGVVRAMERALGR